MSHCRHQMTEHRHAPSHIAPADSPSRLGLLLHGQPSHLSTTGGGAVKASNSNEPSKPTMSSGGYVEALWVYQDPAGREQGPHPAHRMLQWFAAGYFPSTLLLRRVEWPHFLSLMSLMKNSPYPPFSPLFGTDALLMREEQYRGQPAVVAPPQQQAQPLQAPLHHHHLQQLVQQQQQPPQPQPQQQPQQQLLQQAQLPLRSQQPTGPVSVQQSPAVVPPLRSQQPGGPVSVQQSPDVVPPISASGQPAQQSSMYGKVRAQLARSNDAQSQQPHDVQSLLWGAALSAGPEEDAPKASAASSPAPATSSPASAAAAPPPQQQQPQQPQQQQQQSQSQSQKKRQNRKKGKKQQQGKDAAATKPEAPAASTQAPVAAAATQSPATTVSDPVVAQAPLPVHKPTLLEVRLCLLCPNVVLFIPPPPPPSPAGHGGGAAPIRGCRASCGRAARARGTSCSGCGQAKPRMDSRASLRHDPTLHHGAGGPRCSHASAAGRGACQPRERAGCGHAAASSMGSVGRSHCC
jgi:hypothetical protein